MAASGELSVQEVHYISSKLATDMRGAYDSKRLNQSDSKGLYHLATVNMLAKSEQKYQEARFAAQMRQWIDQGMTDKQIQDKLENEPMSIALSMAGPSLNGKQPLGGGRAIPSKTAVKGLLSSIRGRVAADNSSSELYKSTNKLHSDNNIGKNNINFDKTRHQQITENGNRRLAEDFYRSQGFSEKQVLDHIKGIDFKKPVTIEVLNRNKKVYQYQINGASQGNYYALDKNASPTELGINPKAENYNTGIISSRIKGQYKTIQKTKVLKSTASDIIDNFSVPEKPYQTKGGAKQIFSTTKENFKKEEK
ncbi:polymorphic toxin type 46 domain-containing protein [Pasteurella skyensis]|uniref:Polymorphic toxin type 46 domain-containing protein n=1 Tax=Phocoenobacter skyensis TaxID=97481 RepID=A0AAJ6P2W4_9PAST|nr:polymorphic toxin type 46 domain-containing protein [Pasteurella skyensis]MDP8169703.1 polymorphic toxin type 46 domain-containing protein [Pasteurella skyensis]MDP8175129.1 polymorphic toxin type 46 domain-containing protein [Pasteurella skyensis]